MTMFNDRLEGEMKSHDDEGVAKARARKEAKRKELAISIMKSYSESIDIGVGNHCTNFDQDYAARECAARSVKDKVELLKTLIQENKSNESLVKLLVNKIDDLNLLITSIESIEIKGI